ncbi:hypothetical protein ACXYTJ_09820 [Gilvimarinus sp. F26214L]|uniref:hypothetical protein n=1 Tax=Gilvimarinus sp. DZF01 TaxID=3461371 RepID=UPI00404627C4
MTIKSSFAAKLGITTLAVAFTIPAFAAERPDLTGIWTNISMTELSRPKGIDKLVLTPQEADNVAKGLPIAGIPRDQIEADDYTDPDAGAPPAGSIDFGVRGYNAFWTDPGESLALVKGEYRSSYIVEPENGQIPRRAGAWEQRGGINRYVTGIGGNEGPEAMPLSERCLIGFGNTAGPGMLSVLYNNNYQFVQTDDHLMILVEMVHDARIIPIFDSADEARANHRPAVMKPWFGDSVGWYEGDALVVETINIRPEQAANSSIRITDKGHIIERFERHSDTEIFYAFTVHDDTLYTQPWTAELSFHATEGPVYEYACHEGNYAMENILRGARLQEEKAASK